MSSLQPLTRLFSWPDCSMCAGTMVLLYTQKENPVLRAGEMTQQLRTLLLQRTRIWFLLPTPMCGGSQPLVTTISGEPTPSSGLQNTYTRKHTSFFFLILRNKVLILTCESMPYMGLDVVGQAP